MFSREFNLHPPDVWSLTDEELAPYLAALERARKEQNRGA